jgi:hypothetical protein
VKKMAGRLATALDGLSPERIALVVSVGLVLGTFPVFGCPTILCALAAVALRVNLPALQAMNQISTPAQLALLLPLARVGSRMFYSPGGIGGALLQAVVGWFFVCIPCGILLYFILLGLLRRASRQWFDGWRLQPE